MPTIRWFLNDSGLSNLKLRVGETHLDDKITSVNVLDNPDVSKWFKRGELILTTGFVFAGSEKLQRSIVRDLKEIGCAALAVKIRRFFHAIPEALLDEAKRLDLPVIELPFFYGFSEISRIVFDELYREAHADARAEDDFLRQMMDHVLAHDAIETLLQETADFLRLPLVLTDDADAPLSIAVPKAAGAMSFDEAVALAKERAGEPAEDAIPLPNQHGRIFFLRKNGSDELDAPQPDGALLARILQLLALSLEQGNVTRLTEEHRSAFFLRFLMDKKDATEEELRNFCAFYGFDIKSAWICLTFSLAGCKTRKAEVRKLLQELLRTYLPEGARPFFCTNEQLACCYDLFPARCHRLRALHMVIAQAEQTSAELARQGFPPLPSGISACHADVRDLGRALTESLTALSSGEAEPKPHSFLHELPRRLLSLESKASSELCSHFLAPIAAFDRTNHTELLRTLQMYLSCNCNASLAAKELYLHRNTMTNRLEKIKELAGVTLSDAQENMLLSLAILAQEPFTRSPSQ
ncbi:MAG: PucR family transcriptional regulator [Selenomonas sp.]|uniref:PucR family transcriptional regulator n=1 Tax=Selenomonas sp. TaxID=2053611 RepID=UPI0025EF62F8|nr:PucR family transcriptional regulator [Selenomonas sp.]MCI6101154.1 PucR family transcriptional regulator [Selenomonas sp.]MCI6233104.1 PucR family transcriptional regulator [Selenomonas sp.]